MRRSLPVAVTVALVATLLTATPATAQDQPRSAVPLLGAPADLDAGEAVVAPVSDDAHPVTPEVELVSFDEEPAEGTPEAVVEEAASEEAASDEAAADDAVSDEASAESEPDAGVETPLEDDASADGTDGTDALVGEEDGDAAQGDDAHGDESAAGDAAEGDAHVEDAEDDAAQGEDAHGHDHDASGTDLTTQVYASEETPELALLGVTWEIESAPTDLVVEMRTRTGEEWTDWEHLHVEETETRDDEADVAQARSGTTPVALVDVDAVEVRLASDDALPVGASMAVIDPGESTADSAPVTTQATTASAMTTTSTNRPTIYSREQWGADERMMQWTPSQGRVQGITIHHTVNTNNYTQAQVPALMRSIYSYHAQDWGRGWGDIGYNFVVDRFGRIWEGRSGGIDQAPTGAHATGLNSNYAGVSLLGNFDITPVPSAAFLAVARLSAWKLSMHGVTSPYGSVTLDAGTFSRINGHRDSKQTTCPGKYMYNRLGEMRTRISGYLGSFSGRSLDRDLDGDGHADLVVRHGTSVSLMSTVDQGVLSFSRRGTGWSGTKTTSAGDVNGDGHPDLYVIRSSGRMHLYLSTSSGDIRRTSSGTVAVGWGSVSAVAGGVDWNGDGRDDVVTRRGDGTLWLNRGTGGGGLQAGTRLSSASWKQFESITLVPDFSNGRPALLARSKTDGTLYVRVRTTSGGLGSARAIGTSTWRDAAFIAGTPDIVGADGGDLLMVEKDGDLWLIPGTGTGSVVARDKVYLGRAPSDTRRVIPFERTDGVAGFHVVPSSPSIAMRRYAFRWTAHAYEDLKPTGLTVASGDRVVAAGDWDADGRADLMVVRSNGRLMLHVGTGKGRFAATGQQVATGWSSFSAVVGVPNLRGDGVAGVIGWYRSSGKLWYYPSDGDDGFGTRVLISNGATGMDLLVNAGRWNGGGATDLLMRGADSKRLFLYDGNGPGLAFPPTSKTSTYNQMTAIVGVGDVTGDGKPDLAMINSAGALKIYAGDGKGGLTRWREYSTWPRSASLS